MKAISGIVVIVVLLLIAAFVILGWDSLSQMVSGWLEGMEALESNRP